MSLFLELFRCCYGVVVFVGIIVGIIFVFVKWGVEYLFLLCSLIDLFIVMCL